VETDRLEALELSKGLPATASNIERVSKKTSAEAAQWAFTQWTLRKRAIEKGFPKAEEMLFTREALEQASHFAVARYHASLFPKDELVADLTCGIGSDLIAFAERGPAIGFDTDPERAEYARHNLSVHGVKGDVVLGDCMEEEWNSDFAFADPSRRSDGVRLMNRVFDYEPPPHHLAALMESRLRYGAMKLSPVLSNGVLQSLGSSVAFVSFGRECRESLVNIGKADSNRGDIYAVRAETGEWIPTSEDPASVSEPLAYLFEADPAAARAHSLGYLAEQYSLVDLARTFGYLTGDTQISSPWLVGYRVVESGQFDEKHLRNSLRKLGGGRPIVKSRAKGFDPEKISKDLTTEGHAEPIVAVYAIDFRLRYMILERL